MSTIPQRGKAEKTTVSLKQQESADPCQANEEGSSFSLPESERHFDIRDLLSLPKEVADSLERYRRTYHDYVMQIGTYPHSQEELMDFSEGVLNEDDLLNHQAYGQQVLSLDTPILFEDFEDKVENFIPDPSSIEDHTFDYLYEALGRLPKREQKIIEAAFELSDDLPAPEELASSWGITPVQADQLLHDGLERLRGMLIPERRMA